MDPKAWKATLKNYGLWKLSKREYSVSDLKRSMIYRAKRIAKENELPVDDLYAEVEVLIDTWIRQSLVSDDRYKRMMVKSQVARKQGFQAIKYKLKAKGVNLDQETYQQLLTDDGIEDIESFELKRIGELLKRKYPEYRSDRKVAARAFAGLMRKGFSSSLIQKAMKLTFDDV